MNPLPFQVRVCTNFARNGTLIPGKWSFVTSGPKADDEHTFEGLQARIQRTIGFLQSVNTEDVKGGEQMPISFWPSGEPGKGPNFKFETGQKFLTQFAMPNFWFHESTAYAICRMKGVPLGKIDFIAGSGPFE
ncbi:protein of unknown function DUF1993 [Macrophomina phaseolina MS6]|uniref:Uncharacterized protein n=2 Tax=Macrophomina phaseolina TaxID=35725 RepID=K2S0V6_MACPH|nr:protein of unknown function DUF1993 [Macrophomina phaseolina MS6]